MPLEGLQRPPPGSGLLLCLVDPSLITIYLNLPCSDSQIKGRFWGWQWRDHAMRLSTEQGEYAPMQLPLTNLITPCLPQAGSQSAVTEK